MFTGTAYFEYHITKNFNIHIKFYIHVHHYMSITVLANFFLFSTQNVNQFEIEFWLITVFEFVNEQGQAAWQILWLQHDIITMTKFA